LPRQAGHKDARYVHLLAGAPELTDADRPTASETQSVRSTQSDRVTKLEEQVESLTQQVSDLTAQFAEFKKQFE